MAGTKGGELVFEKHKDFAAQLQTTHGSFQTYQTFLEVENINKMEHIYRQCSSIFRKRNGHSQKILRNANFQFREFQGKGCTRKLT